MILETPTSLADIADWDTFVAESVNGTLFHRRDFLAYHGNRFRGLERPLVWRAHGTIVGAMAMAQAGLDQPLVLKSPYGASYGGIVHGQIGLAEAEEMVDLLVHHLKAEGIQRLTLTPTPAIYMDQPSDYLAFWLLKRGFRIINSDLTAYIPVIANPLEGLFDRSSNKAVRKAIRDGVEVVQNDDLDTFYNILLENRKRFQATPTHSKSEVAWLLNHLPGAIRLFMAYRHGRALAGTLVFKCNDRVLLDFYWAHREDDQQFRPVNLLVHEVTQWAAGQGLRWFDFGTQTVDMVPNQGGSRFKESMGATGIFRHTYCWESEV